MNIGIKDEATAKYNKNIEVIGHPNPAQNSFFDNILIFNLWIEKQ